MRSFNSGLQNLTVFVQKALAAYEYVMITKGYLHTLVHIIRCTRQRYLKRQYLQILRDKHAKR